MKNNFIILAVGTAIYFLLLYFAAELVSVLDKNRGITEVLIIFGIVSVVIGYLAPRVFQPQFSKSAYLAVLFPVIILGVGAFVESVKAGHFYMGEKASLFIGMYVVQAVLLLISVGSFLALHSMKARCSGIVRLATH